LARSFRLVLPVGVALLLLGCGGGGGGGGSGDEGGERSEVPAQLELATSVAVFRSNLFQNQSAANSFTGAGGQVGLAFVRSRVTAPIYLKLEDSAGLLSLDAFGMPLVDPPAGYTYPSRLQVSSALPPGTYPGTAQFVACADAACTSRYSVAGGSLPYELTVTPLLRADVFANGIASGSVQSGDAAVPITLADGGSIEFRSSIPVQVQYSAGPGIVQVSVDPASTPQVWKATLQRDAFLGGTQQLTLSLVPADWSLGTQRGPWVDVTVTP
jgi:hypothetical protein